MGKFKHIYGFEGLYSITPFGVVKSLKAGKVKKHIISPKGYVRISLYRDSKQHVFFLHRVVAMMFLGEMPTPLHQVNHKDGNKKNNHFSNLEWVTCSENQIHAIETGLRVRPDLTVRNSVINQLVNIEYVNRRRVAILLKMSYSSVTQIAKTERNKRGMK